MNLNNNPTTQDLSKLLNSCNDSAGHHILWVSQSGDVSITLLSNLSPIAFEQSEPSMAMRHETFNQGNDYVGPQAANDINYVSGLLDSLIGEWSKYSGQGVRYIG